MKPSEALREGIKKWPVQAFGTMFQDIDGVKAACAYGAIVDVTRLAGFDEIYRYMWSEVRCPIGHRKEPLQSIIMKLNDDRWTREAIAEWLERCGL